jgi:LacI family transcriptional regulator
LADRQRKPTMVDVAEQAGVALKTVSRVVNREPGVSENMAKRVNDAIAALGYRHNSGASSLRRIGQATASIGLVLEDVSNPFSSALHRAIEDVARDRGYLLLAGSSDEDQALERELVEIFCMRRVDGLIVVPSGDDHEYLLREIRGGTPLVLVDRPSKALPMVDTVLSDNFEGAASGTRHLIEHGHRQLAFLGDSLTIETARARLAGFKSALAALNGRGEPTVVTGLRTVEQADAALTEILARTDPPTAVFASQNLNTIGAIRALRRSQLHDKVALVGFDDVPMADLLVPGLTVVAQDPVALGRRAADLVLRRIAGDAGAAERITLQTTLIVRGSGEIRPT